MSENPERKSGAFQSDAFQTEIAPPEPPPQPHATSPLNSLRRAATRIRGAILRLLPFLVRVPRSVTAGIAAVLILFGAAREWRTPSLPINSPPPRMLGWTWWATPRQLNPERTLPAFDHAIIEAVATVPGGKRVCIAGDAGLLAYSDDDGASWTTFHYDPSTGSMLKDAPVAVATSAPLVTWRAEAAQVQQQAPVQQQANPGPRQQTVNAPTQTKGGKGPSVSRAPHGTTLSGQKSSQGVPAQNSGKTPPPPARPQAPPKDPPNWNIIQFSGHNVTLAGVAARNLPYQLYSSDAGSTWTRQPPANFSYSAPLPGRRYQSLLLTGYLKPANANIFAVVSPEPGQTWAAGEQVGVGPVIYHYGAGKGPDYLTLQYPTSDNIYPRWQGTTFVLRGITFREDAKTGFAVGTQGAILRTRDGGQHWEPITRGAAAPGKSTTDYRWWQRPVRIPAPLSLLVFLFALVFLIPAAMPEVVPRASAVRSIANLAVSDAPVFLAEKDELGFTPVARAIAGLLRNKATGLPLTVAINAPWGRGKTSLMSLVQQELKASGWRTVWFNAWHHQEETSMLASLLQTVRLKAPPELMTRGGLRYRVQLLAKRLWHWRTLWTIAAVVALYLGEAVVHDHNPHMYVNGAQYLFGVVTGGRAPGEKPGAADKPAEKPGVLQVGAQMLLDLARSSKETGPGHLIPFAVLVSFLFLLMLQVLQSFGANPAELLAKTSDRKTVAGLEAQTSFLEKFRRQYGEVVGALGKYRLAIFVDDLDRCRPDKIAEMLEAANYLMAAGPCALVLALEEHAVISGLGLSFQRMAEEIGKLPENRRSAAGDLLAEAKERREEFAKNYVEKLFNVVVQTPPVATDRFAGLLAGRGALQIKLRERERRRRWMRQAGDVARVPTAAMILAALLFGGYGLLRSWLPPSETQTATRQVPQPNAPGAGARNAAPAPVTAGAATPSIPPGSAILPTYTAAQAPIPTAWFETWWQRLLWGLLAVSILLPLSMRRPQPLVKDSPDFEEALRIWAPVLAEVNPSPRFGKRVLNRVRYLAMLERQTDQELLAADPTRVKASTARIPETLLVAFSVLGEVRREAVQSFEGFNEFLAQATEHASDVEGSPVFRAYAAHKHQFFSTNTPPSDPQLNEWRQRFVNLSAGIVAR